MKVFIQIKRNQTGNLRMEMNEKRGMVKCWHCESIGYPVIAADDTIRCKACAKPIGRASEMLESAVPIDVRKTGSDDVIVIALIIIIFLFLPIRLWIFVIPILLCLYFAFARDQKTIESEPGIV